MDTEKQLKDLFPGKKILFKNINVKDKSNVDNVFRDVVNNIGPLDIVIKRAGVLNDKTIENMIGVNVLGLIDCTQTALTHMALDNGGKGGIITNIASVVGLDTLFSVPVYTASKHVVTGYTAALADERLEKKFGVKFVTICPGFTDTSLIHNLNSSLMSDDLLAETEKYAVANGNQS